MTDYIDATLKMSNVLLCVMCAYPATTRDETCKHPLCASCKADEAAYIAERDNPIELPPELLAVVDRSRERALNEAVARMRAPSNALPAAPTVNIDHTPDTFTSLETPTAAGREDAALLQTPNLIRRWEAAIKKARETNSPIDRQEWLTEAQNLCERLVDTACACDCGIPYNALTKRCDDCDERERLKQERRAHIGMTGRQRDAGVPF